MDLSNLEPAPAPELVLTRQAEPTPPDDTTERGQRFDDEGLIRQAMLTALFIKDGEIAREELVQVRDVNGILYLNGSLSVPCAADYIALSDGRVVVAGAFPVMEGTVIDGAQWR